LSEIFERIIQEMLVGLTGTISLADDILVWGTDRASHDRNLNATLTVLPERGATLNVDKCLIAVTDLLVFFGLRITDKSIGISQEKLKALLEAPPSKSPGETLSYIGLATFCERFTLPAAASLRSAKGWSPVPRQVIPRHEQAHEDRGGRKPNRSRTPA